MDGDADAKERAMLDTFKREGIDLGAPDLTDTSIGFLGFPRALLPGTVSLSSLTFSATNWSSMSSKSN